VVWNLLRNAAEAMPAGGTITVTTSVKEDAKRQAILMVRDTGVGIAREDLDHIFEPFFSRKVGGTGLGLATTARIVEDHHGTIDVLSQRGQGTTFTVHLPSL
jgi:signal transduction histidine kinase